MDIFENLISSIDCILDSKSRRHITGGILLSISMFFGGLAVTVVTLRNEENRYEE